MKSQDYIKKVLRLIEENPDVPVRIMANVEDYLPDYEVWALMEFCSEPKLVNIVEYNDLLYFEDDDDLRNVIEDYIYTDNLSDDEIEKAIDAEIDELKKPVILLAVTGSTL